MMTRIKCFCGFSDHLFFLLLTVKVFLEGNVIMQNVFSLNFLESLLLLFLLCCRVMHKVQLITIVDGQFIATGLTDSPKDAINNLVSPVGGSISEWMIVYR